MSIRVELIPLAIALRAAMGEKNFREWVESQQVRLPTAFGSAEDLIRTVKLAGYDVLPWSGLYKTHVKGEEIILFWEKRGETWEALFSVGDDKEVIRAFIRDLEAKAGRVLFPVSGDAGDQLGRVTKTYPTNFRSEPILLQTLRDSGLKPARSEQGEITCTVGNYRVRFLPGRDGPYVVEVSDVRDAEAVFQHLALLDEDYKRCAQSATYESLMKKVQEKGFLVESEEVLDDNSIVITLNILR